MSESTLCEILHVKHTVNYLFTLTTHVKSVVTVCAFVAKIGHATGVMVRGSNPGKERDFSLLQNAHTDSGAQSVSY
jgi:hypothetical protein